MVNMLNEGWLWYKNMGLDHAMISIPLLETAMLFIALTLCLLFRCSRTGLILAYLFVYRWGWSVREQTMSQDPMTQTAFLIGYLVFGILVFTFTVIGMLHNSLREE